MTPIQERHEARRHAQAGRVEDAAAAFRRAFEREPKMWWLALEALRAMRAAQGGPRELSWPRPGATVQLLFSPFYRGNSYQANQYSRAAEFGAQVQPIEQLELDEGLARRLSEGPVVFHQQWLKEIYWRAGDMADGLRRVDRHMSILRALKAMGVPVWWTLHNLLDHDLDEVRRAACSHALREMAQVADRILVHSQGSVTAISAFCDQDLSAKCTLLEHPLYDNIAALPRDRMPREIEPSRLAGRRVAAFVGMIRPYKGVAELLQAWQLLVQQPALADRVHLIVAGRLLDEQAAAALKVMAAQRPDLISVVGRELQEVEMAAILDRCELMVAPYRNILISGSYYLATSFARPVLAPARGLFTEVVDDGRNGFLYDGSPQALAARLAELLGGPPDRLVQAGSRALAQCRDLSIARMSERFFRLLGTNL